ncbi:MAG: tetratricopeptide repeat protein [Gemmatimonadota bacterium]
MAESNARDVARFGTFRFDSRTGELHRGPHLVRLAPKPAQVLNLLVRAEGQLVTRGEIEEAVWGDTPVDLDRSVNFAIRQIRSALGDRAEAPVFIETLPKRGYRLIAPVSWEADRGEIPVGEPTSHGAPSRYGRRFAGAAALLAALALVTGAVWGRSTSPASAEDVSPTTLAILPFEERRSGVGDAFFLDGLTDELITVVARLDPHRLAVIAPTSARLAAAASPDDGVVADALTARYLLRGAVSESDGSIRINVRLVDAADGSVLWADRFLGHDVGSADLQYEIASRVATALREPLSLDAQLPALRPVAPETRDAFLRGSYLLTQGWSRTEEAISTLETAVRSDSLHAPSRVALARALIRWNRRAEARVHLADAVRIDPLYAPAHIVLGTDALYGLWDLEAADAHFERALAMDPGNVLSHHPYAYHLSIAGRHDEAIAEISAALRLDPVSPLVNGDVGRIFYRAGRFDEAEEQCARTLELDPDHPNALSCLINIRLLAGDAEGALPYALASWAAADSAALDRDALAALPADEAMERYWLGRVDALRAGIARGWDDGWVPLAQAYVWLGRTEEALDALEEALARRSSILMQVPGDPCFAVLVGLPRFDALVAAMGLDA